MLTEVSTTYVYLEVEVEVILQLTVSQSVCLGIEYPCGTCDHILDALRWTLYRTPVGSLENAVLCCVLFTKPYHSNDRAVLLRVCVAMGMLLHSNEHLQISTVADRLSMFADQLFNN
jgi:hypothetical protein